MDEFVTFAGDELRELIQQGLQHRRHRGMIDALLAVGDLTAIPYAVFYHH